MVAAGYHSDYAQIAMPCSGKTSLAFYRTYKETWPHQPLVR